jgi:DNA-binding transcriptional ArsR family regulator
VYGVTAAEVAYRRRNPPPPRPKPAPHLNGSRPSEAKVEADVAVLPLLEICDIADLIARVDNAPTPRWRLRPIIAEGDHVMFAADQKALKTWMTMDAGISVASGTSWLGIFPAEAPGSVLVFAGEGGPRKFTRRARAIARSKGLDLATLPLRVCMRVPHLTSDAAMLLVEEEVAQHQPAFIIVDPLYLAARGARGSDLYEMGAHLERIQTIAQAHGAALLIVHHWNKTGEGKGAHRMSGAGPAAWGRVLISASIVNRRTDETTKTSITVLDLAFQGDEIAETTVRVRAKIWADDPDELASDLHYEVEQLEALIESDVESELTGLRPAAVRVLRVLEAATEYLTVGEIGDALAVDSTGRTSLKPRTIQEALKSLSEADLVESTSLLGGNALRWRVCVSQEAIGDAVEGSFDGF